MINKFRRLLIQLGKVCPFVICFFVLVNYIEICTALLFKDYIVYENSIILNTQVSFFINKYIEYDIQMLFVLCVTSIAIETCLYNKLACLYLGVNLIEKSYFDFEIEENTVYVIAITNIIVSTWITYKGIKMLTIK